MNKLLKRSGVALVLLLLVAVVGGAIFLLNFDPKVYQDRLVKEVKLRYERDLKINGDIEVSVFPRIGLRVSDVTLSNKNSDEEFSSMEEVRFGVALWPLLFDRFLVDHVKVSGFKSHIVRYADGSLNIDDFYALPPDFDQEQLAHRRQQIEAAGGSRPRGRMEVNEFKVDIAGLDLEGGSVLFEDQSNERQFSLEDMNIYTGRITFAEPFSLTLTAKVDARDSSDNATLNMRGMMRLDPVGSIYEAERLNATLQGQIKGYKIDEASLSGNFSLDDYSGYANAKAFKLLLNLSALDRQNSIANFSLETQADELGLSRVDTQLLAENLSLNGSVADSEKRLLSWQLNSPNLNFSDFDAAGEPLTGTVQFKGEESMDVNVSLDGFSGLASDLRVKESKLQGKYLSSANRDIDIDLASPLNLNLLRGGFEFEELSGVVRLSDVDMSQEASVSGFIRGALLSELKPYVHYNIDALIDSERLHLVGSLDGLSKPKVNFSLTAETLDLDRVLGVERSANTKTADEPKTTAKIEKTLEDAEVADGEAPSVSEITIPAVGSLSLNQELLSRLSGYGVLAADKLTYRGLEFLDFSTGVAFGSGSNFDFESFQAKVFGGELSSSLGLSLDSGRVDLNFEIVGADIDQLLQYFKARVLLNGKAVIQGVLQSQGFNQQELVNNLDGNLKLGIKQGVLHGFSVNKVLDDINYIVDTGSQQLFFDESEQTPFESFMFDSQIDRGVISFDEFKLEDKAFSLHQKGSNSSYNFLNGNLDMHLQFTAKRPVSAQRGGVKVKVKRISIPIQIWNEQDSIQIKTEIQGLHQ